MRLDFNKIISNSLTVLVATVFVGAAAQLWNGVQSIDHRIDENLVEIRATQKVLAPKVDEIAVALADLLMHLDHGDEFKIPARPSLDLIDEQRANNQMMQQQQQRVLPAQ
tara:strand:- start:5919 stop:6248 length:330 start_codon:yes stop_codon:yes gene_type:complete